MAKGANQKLKLLYLLKILTENTDEDHAMTLSQIITALAGYGISVERKSIYSDIEALRVFGIDVVSRKTKSYEYYVASRAFELPELKLLVDAVQSSKFITHKKSRELIHKLEGLESVHNGKLLHRQVYVANRVKTVNETIYYNIDKLHEAINSGCKISFQYFEWAVSFGTTEKFVKRPRKDGKLYVVSPWALSWDDENYYLVAYDDTANIIKHYRVDKMMSIQVLEEQRQGQECFKQFDMAQYSKKVFSMFGGTEEAVRLRFNNNLIGVVVDRFGKDVKITKEDEESFIITVSVEVSAQFFAWLCGFGDEVKILSPDDVIKEYRRHCRKIMRLYKDNNI